MLLYNFPELVTNVLPLSANIPEKPYSAGTFQFDSPLLVLPKENMAVQKGHEVH